jgi:hypothetical protein
MSTKSEGDILLNQEPESYYEDQIIVQNIDDLDDLECPEKSRSQREMEKQAN